MQNGVKDNNTVQCICFVASIMVHLQQGGKKNCFRSSYTHSISDLSISLTTSDLTLIVFDSHCRVVCHPVSDIWPL